MHDEFYCDIAFKEALAFHYSNDEKCSNEDDEAEIYCHVSPSFLQSEVVAD